MLSVGNSQRAFPMIDCVRVPRRLWRLSETMVKRRFSSCSQYQSDESSVRLREALFALAQHFLGLLALHELSDLRADDVDRLHQALVRLADFAAVEGENADHLSFRIHRKDECAVHARLDGDRLLPHARVPRDVRDPHRLARLPHLSGQPDTRV